MHSNQTSSGVLLSILIISRTIENMNNLLTAIDENDINFAYEVLCSWNGEATDLANLKVPMGVDFHLFEQRPYNFACNNNLLADRACGTYLLFLNDDIIPDRGAIRCALNAIENPSIGMVGINLRYPDGFIQHAGVFFKDGGVPFHRDKHKAKWDDPRFVNDMFVPAITGAFILIRRIEFNAIKFDESFEVCGEDIALNLCYRSKFDREILYVGRATALHIENATRRITGETKTPPEDLSLILGYSQLVSEQTLTVPKTLRIRIVTEKPGWIMYRKAEEIQKYLGTESVRINEDWDEADIHYYINFHHLKKRPKQGLVVAILPTMIQISTQINLHVQLMRLITALLSQKGRPAIFGNLVLQILRYL